MGTCVEEKNQEGKNGKKKKKFRVRLNSFQSTKILINFKTKCPFGLQWFWRLRFSSTFFSFFFFFFSLHSLLCQLWTVHPCIFHGFHKLHFSATFLLKMGPTTLFTHLKIISLQFFQFQFSVSVKISLIQTDPKRDRWISNYIELLKDLRKINIYLINFKL